MKKIVFLFCLLTVNLTACSTAKQSPEEKILKYMEKAEEFYEQENYNKAKVNLEKALHLSKNEYGDISRETAKIYLKLADFSTAYSESIDLLKEAEEIYQDLADIEGLANTYIVYGSTYYRSNDRDLSENAYKKALQYCDLSDHEMNEERFHAYVNLAGLGNGTEEEDLLYNQEAEKLLEMLPEDEKNYSKMRVYNNLGNSYLNLNENELAIENYEKAIDIWLKYGEGGELRAAEAYDNCGYLYALTGNCKKAINYIDESLKLFGGMKKVKLWQHAVAYWHMSATYALCEIQDYDKAIDYGIRSCQLYTEKEELNSEELKELRLFKDALKSLYEKSPLAEKQDFESWYIERINQ